MITAVGNVTIPNLEKATLAESIRACGETRDRECGRRIHTEVLASSHRSSVYLLNLVVEMYGKCGSLDDAKQAFDSIQGKNRFSWNILIAAFVANGAAEEAVAAFELAPCVDLVTRNSVLMAYARLGDLDKARMFFDEKMPFHDIVSWTTMITMCSSHGEVLGAREVFNAMPERGMASWNAILAVIALAGEICQGRALFDQMPSRDLLSWTAMVQCCCVGGDMELAREYFDRMPQHDAVVWNVMIHAHARHGDLDVARSLIGAMPQPNAISWTIIVAGYASSSDFDAAWMILERIASDQALKSSDNRYAAPWNTMIKALLERNRLEEARCVLNKMPVIPSPSSWMLLLTAYFHAGHLQQAKSIFDAMPVKDSQAWTALLQGYSQLGHGQHTSRTFSTCPFLDAVTWSVVIGGLALNGHLAKAMELFYEMQCVGLNPSDGAFVALVNACAHFGLAKTLQSQLRGMVMDVNRPVSVEMYSSMADLLGRAGEAVASRELVSSMPFARDVVLDGTLLCNIRLIY